MATYVLIPGGGGDAWELHRLVPELEARGHDVVPVDLPADDDTAGWSEYVDAVVAAIGGRRIEADEIPGGHMVAMSHPRELAERLERYRAELERGSR